MDKSPMQIATELTRQMNNMQKQLDNLHVEERSLEKSMHNDVQRFEHERTQKQGEMVSQAEREARGDSDKDRADLLREDMRLLSEERNRRKEADNQIRDIRRRATSLAGEIENIKHEIVKYQAQAGL